MEGSCAPFDIVLCDQKQKISKQIQKHIQPFDVKKGYGTQAGIQKAQHDKPVDRGRFGENSRLAYCRRMMASTRNAKIIEKILSITYLVLSK